MARRLCDAVGYPPVLLAVAAYALPGTTRSLPSGVLDDDTWRTMVGQAVHHRVIGLMRAAERDGALPVSAGQSAELGAAHRDAALHVLALERDIVELAALLDDAGVDVRFLKGPAAARLDYARPGLRTYVDVDVLVREADIDRAVQSLTTAGYRRTLAEPRAGFDARFDKGVTFVGPRGHELDLHRTFVLGPWGRLVDLDALWDDCREFDIAGHRFAALADVHRFVHACYHAALGNWPLRLASLRDVAEMAWTADVEAVVRTATSWGVEAVIAAAVSDTWRLLGIDRTDASATDLVTWAACYRPTRREEAWLNLHTHGDKTFAAQALATVAVLPGVRAKVAYLRALAFPDSQYVADRHGSRMARFRFGVREIRRGRERR